jgi:hypothetical protein
VRRSSPDFWATSDWFNHQFAVEQPIEAALLGLNRNKNFFVI